MENLRKLRIMENLSQQELANMINVNEQEIEMYESGKKSPTIEKLKELSKIFYVDLSTLVDKRNFWLLFPTANHRKLACRIAQCKPQTVEKVKEVIDGIIKKK